VARSFKEIGFNTLYVLIRTSVVEYFAVAQCRLRFATEI
jgi:hypothetical protein